MYFGPEFKSQNKDALKGMRKGEFEFNYRSFFQGYFTFFKLKVVDCKHPPNPNDFKPSEENQNNNDFVSPLITLLTLSLDARIDLRVSNEDVRAMQQLHSSLLRARKS